MSADTDDPDTEAVDSCTVQQAIDGTPVGVGIDAMCVRCKAVLSEGDDVAVYAYRLDGDGVWNVASLYCDDCSPFAVPRGTLGIEEVAATARLALIQDCATQSCRLTVLASRLVHESPPDEGGEP